MKLWTKEERIALGVNDKEFTLLSVLHKEGAQNTSTLSHKASLPRVTTMRILKTLKERGFVTKLTKSREVVWSMVKPRTLEKRLLEMFGGNDDEQKVTELSEVGSLIIYRGIEEVLASNKKILEANSGGRLLAIEPNGIWKHVPATHQGVITDMNLLFKEKQFVMEMVIEEGFEECLALNADPRLAETFLKTVVDVRVVPARFLDSATEVLIFRDQILFIDWAHLVAVEIKNPSTVRVLRAMYRLLQESGRPYVPVGKKR